MTDKCRGCGAKMVWATTAKGEKIPLDPRAPTYVIEGDLLGARRAVRVPSMVSHFSVCPKKELFAKANRLRTAAGQIAQWKMDDEHRELEAELIPPPAVDPLIQQIKPEEIEWTQPPWKKETRA